MKPGTELYTPAEAGALLHERPRTVRRWVSSEGRPAVIRDELPAIEGERALMFVELVELLSVRAFRRAGASLVHPRGGVGRGAALRLGAPVGIRASTLADAVDAEGPASGGRTIDRVAWIYEIEPRHVHTALAFRRWVGAARRSERCSRLSV